MDIAKSEVKNSIVKRINELLLHKNIVFRGRTMLKYGDKDYFIKTIENPHITELLTNVDGSSLNKPIIFSGTGDFVFVEDISQEIRNQNSLTHGENDYSFSGEASLERNGNDYVVSIKDNALTVICKHQ